MTEKPIHHKPEPAQPVGKFRQRYAKFQASKNPLARLLRFLMRGFSRLFGELTAIILGLAFIWVYGMNYLLSEKTVDVSFLKSNVGTWFSQAFEGRSAEIDQMELRWQPIENTLVLDVRDVTVKDKYRTELQTLKFVSAVFDLNNSALKRRRPVRVTVDGGSVTWLTEPDGSMTAGLGTPETVGKLGTFFSSSAGPIEIKPQPVGARRTFDMGTLRSIDLKNVTAYVRDESRGIDVVLTEVDLIVDKAGDKFRVLHHGSTEVDADVGGETTYGSYNLRALFSADYEDFSLLFETDGLNPARLLPLDKGLNFLAGIDALVDMSVDFEAQRGLGITKARLNFNAGEGQILRGPARDKINRMGFLADYNKETQTLDLADITFGGTAYDVRGDVSLGNIGTVATGLFEKDITFDFALNPAKFDITSIFDAPFDFAKISGAGVVTQDRQRVDFTNLRLDFGAHGLDTNLSFLRSASGGLEGLTGQGQGWGDMMASDLLALWPSKFAGGARRWIQRSILKGFISDLKFVLDIDADGLRGVPLDDEDLTMEFSVRDGDVQYISTMTPFTNTQGVGVLRGNSFEIETRGGQVGNLISDSAKVDIPRLRPKGGDLNISVKGRGTVPDMLTLIDQKPFEFSTRYGIIPDNFGGNGEINLTIKRPLLEFFDQERISYGITGLFTDVKAPFSMAGFSLDGGAVALKADRESMKISGPVTIGPWAVDLIWQDKFDMGATPTTYNVKGRLDRDTLDGFGIGFRQYLGGHIDVELDAIGTGMNISETLINADLTPADITIADYWHKPPGIAGSITGRVARTSDGALIAQNVVIRAPQLSLEGQAEVASDFKLLNFELSKAKIDGVIDASINIRPSQSGEQFDVGITGKYMDISPFVSQAMVSQKSGILLPMNLTGQIARLALGPSFIVSGAKLALDYDGAGMKTASLEGVTRNGDFIAKIAPRAEGKGRLLELDIPNASNAATAFFKLDNIKGGRMKVEARLPATGQTGPTRGVVSVDDFVLIEAPILARMLSLASLKGLTDAMGGAGLNFSKLDIPFAFEAGRLSVRDASAAGSALGLTGSGEVDLRRKIVDMTGVLVPAYSANSLLASVPVIGDIFVGKKGEGIFALNYSVKGTFKQTQVAVNPLSALTPGFLRRIFDTERKSLDEIESEGQQE